MDDPVRCPYCVVGDDFKIMTQWGHLLVCMKCNHVESPNDPTYICRCPKCDERNPRIG
jgi:hypothetical protein